MKLQIIAYLLTATGCAVAAHSGIEFGAHRPVAAAHRAEHSRNSENSIESIKSAQENNIRLIEIDIRESLDGDLFLFHNKKLDPETVSGPKELVGREFKSLTTAEISKVRLPKGESIPSFESAADVLKADSSFILDVKGGVETRTKVIERIKRGGGNKNYWMLCYDPLCAAEVKRSGVEGIKLLARLNKELTLTQALLEDPKIIQINCEESCSKEVGEIKTKQKKALILATSLKPELDQESNWKRLTNDGVDIILTDKPLQLISLSSSLEQQNQ